MLSASKTARQGLFMILGILFIYNENDNPGESAVAHCDEFQTIWKLQNYEINVV